MVLYYTVSSATDDQQTKAALSLGGFRSNTQAPNNVYQNLFSNLSCQSVKTGADEHIALMLRNETGADITGATLYFNFPTDTQKDVQVALVTPNSSGQIERTQSPFIQPYYATFQSADGVANAIALPDLANEAQIGLWFKRIINESVILDQYTDTNLINNGNPERADEDIELIITWP